MIQGHLGVEKREKFGGGGGSKRREGKESKGESREREREREREALHNISNSTKLILVPLVR